MSVAMVGVKGLAGSKSRDWRAVGDITEYMEPSNNVRGYIIKADTGGCVLSLGAPLTCEGEPLRG